MKGLLHRFQMGHIKPASLSAFLDAAVSDSEYKKITRHLSDCTQCHAEMLGLQRTVHLLRTIPEVPVPRSFALTASVTVVKADLSRIRRAPLMAAAAMAVALVVVLVSDGLGLVGPQGQQTVVHLAMEEQAAVVRTDASGGPASPISMDTKTTDVDRAASVQSTSINTVDATQSRRTDTLNGVGSPFDLWMLELGLLGAVILLGITAWAGRNDRSSL